MSKASTPISSKSSALKKSSSVDFFCVLKDRIEGRCVWGTKRLLKGCRLRRHSCRTSIWRIYKKEGTLVLNSVMLHVIIAKARASTQHFSTVRVRSADRVLRTALFLFGNTFEPLNSIQTLPRVPDANVSKKHGRSNCRWRAQRTYQRKHNRVTSQS